MASIYPVVVVLIATIGSVLAAHCMTTVSDTQIEAKQQALAQLNVAELVETTKDLQSDMRVAATLELQSRAKAEPDQIEEVTQELLKLLTDENELVRAAAEISLSRLGAAAVPVLEAAFDAPKTYGIGALCTAVKAIGPPAAPVLPKLQPLLDSGDPGLQRAALYALIGLKHHGLPALDDVIDCLSSADFNVQCFACRVLEPLGPDAYPAEEALLKVMETGNPSTRGWAAIVLGSIGPTTDNDVVPVLEQYLVEARAQMEKQRILLGFAHLGPEAKRAEDTIRQYFENANHHVQPHAAYALYRINGQPEPFVEAIRKSLDNRDQQFDAFDIIAMLDGEEALPLLDVLRGKLGSDDEDVRERTVLAIARMGPTAADALPDLQAMQNDPDALVRSAVADAIIVINAPEPEKSDD